MDYDFKWIRPNMSLYNIDKAHDDSEYLKKIFRINLFFQQMFSKERGIQMPRRVKDFQGGSHLEYDRGRFDS